MFCEQAKDLCERFTERGYPDAILRDSYKNALSKESASLLTKKPPKDADTIMRVIGTFDEASVPIRKIFTQHWNILGLDPDLMELVGPRPQVTCRRGSSLLDRLVKCHFAIPSRTTNWLTQQLYGCYKCSGCVACSFIQTGSHFLSNQTEVPDLPIPELQILFCNLQIHM